MPPWTRSACPVLALAALSLALPAAAADFYVTPTGKSAGDGSPESPWSLAKAFSHPASVKPGDTIWLRGGTYVGPFASQLKGTASKPIIVRQYPGERVTIDGNDGTEPGDHHRARLLHVVLGLRDHELGPHPLLRCRRGLSPPRHRRPPAQPGIQTDQHGRSTTPAQGVLTNGCRAGRRDQRLPHLLQRLRRNRIAATATGSTFRTRPGIKRIIDNIIFQQFGWGIHALHGEAASSTTSTSKATRLSTTGCCPTCPAPKRTSSSAPTARPRRDPGRLRQGRQEDAPGLATTRYFSSADGVAANLGYSKGIASPTILDNYLVGGTGTSRSSTPSGRSR